MSADTNNGGAVAVRTPETGRERPAIRTDADGNIPPSQLIMQGIERGLSAETMKELVALQHQIEDRNAVKAFFEAMAALQDSMPAIKKTKTAKITTTTGGSYSYTYAPLDEIVKVLRPLARKHGFAWQWDQEELKDGKARTTLRISHVAGHTKENHFTLPTASKSAMSEQQKQGAANTFAKRQTLVDGFGLITTDEDLDGAEPQDPTTIDGDQLTHLEDLLTETGADRKKFLRFLDVATLQELPASEYARAVSALERKKKGAAS